MDGKIPTGREEDEDGVIGYKAPIPLSLSLSGAGNCSVEAPTPPNAVGNMPAKEVFQLVADGVRVCCGAGFGEALSTEEEDGDLEKEGGGIFVALSEDEGEEVGAVAAPVLVLRRVTPKVEKMLAFGVAMGGVGMVGGEAGTSRGTSSNPVTLSMDAIEECLE